jgi:hypothetical protein
MLFSKLLNLFLKAKMGGNCAGLVLITIPSPNPKSIPRFLDIEIPVSDLFRVWRSVVLWCPSILSILASHQHQDV